MIGYRGWRIWGDDLYALNSPCPWQPGLNVASCRCTRVMVKMIPLTPKELAGGTDSFHYGFKEMYAREPVNHAVAPAVGGTCGLWMRESYEEMGRGDLAWEVLGLIEAWGTCIKHAMGLRCEKARIVALYAPRYIFDEYGDCEPSTDTEAVRRIGLRYDVPVVSTLAELEEIRLK